jgi:hypothetical protein
MNENTKGTEAPLSCDCREGGFRSGRTDVSQIVLEAA